MNLKGLTAKRVYTMRQSKMLTAASSFSNFAKYLKYLAKYLKYLAKYLRNLSRV